MDQHGCIGRIERPRRAPGQTAWAHIVLLWLALDKAAWANKSFWASQDLTKQCKAFYSLTSSRKALCGLDQASYGLRLPYRIPMEAWQGLTRQLQDFNKPDPKAVLTPRMPGNTYQTHLLQKTISKHTLSGHLEPYGPSKLQKVASEVRWTLRERES